jgi:hypothetical protein
MARHFPRGRRSHCIAFTTMIRRYFVLSQIRLRGNNCLLPTSSNCGVASIVFDCALSNALTAGQFVGGKACTARPARFETKRLPKIASMRHARWRAKRKRLRRFLTRLREQTRACGSFAFYSPYMISSELRLRLARLRIRWFDPISQGFGIAEAFGDRWSPFFVTDSLGAGSARRHCRWAMAPMA